MLPAPKARTPLAGSQSAAAGCRFPPAARNSSSTVFIVLIYRLIYPSSITLCKFEMRQRRVGISGTRNFDAKHALVIGFSIFGHHRTRFFAAATYAAEQKTWQKRKIKRMELPSLWSSRAKLYCLTCISANDSKRWSGDVILEPAHTQDCRPRKG